MEIEIKENDRIDEDKYGSIREQSIQVPIPGNNKD